MACTYITIKNLSSKCHQIYPCNAFIDIIHRCASIRNMIDRSLSSCASHISTPENTCQFARHHLWYLIKSKLELFIVSSITRFVVIRLLHLALVDAIRHNAHQSINTSPLNLRQASAMSPLSALTYLSCLELDIASKTYQQKNER